MTVMTEDKKKSKRGLQIDEAMVADYLRAHPDFFIRHDGLLAELSLSHQSGQAVSLIERQVAVLREQNRHSRQQLKELIEIAEKNDALAKGFRDLSLGFLACQDGSEALILLERSLRQDFHADMATLLLRGDASLLPLMAPEGGLIHLLREDPQQQLDLPTSLSQGVSVCGRFGREIMLALFGERATDVSSAALVPIPGLLKGEGDALALLAIGSRDGGRFSAGMGTDFLDYLGALLGHRLAKG